ncbi:Pyrimidine-specific ribonucleoside hydrolase rihA [Anaerotruncus sp. 2789STDY5834896]|uniref:Pyrimidine-specific ribonucleoside hydrolase rihA n=1 Tax=uncultured Anaerotruncus sp. TaxID=905011 RepID=A0A1C6JXT6_9FIRM|nr:Pyrimidine-specific ribonucleoside hydrolase rihA [uncultured Anaerotruncus sp.]
MKKIPLIIDCDPGTDDAVAILLANSCPHIDLLALTPVAGNSSYTYTSDNAVRLAGFMGGGCRVAKGAEQALIFDGLAGYQNKDDIHGGHGMAGVLIENRAGAKQEDKFAWDVIYEEALAHPGELVIAAIGPLTNIAITLLKHPDIRHYVKRIYMMGGSATTGNVSPYAEFNVWVDPHACDIVFKSGIPVTMVGLNATRHAEFTLEEFEQLTDTPCAITFLLAAINKFIKEILRQGRRWDLIMHDAITVGALIDPDMVKTAPYYVTCETESSQSIGQTVVDRGGHLGRTPNVDVAMYVDKARFKDMLQKMIAFYR